MVARGRAASQRFESDLVRRGLRTGLRGPRERSNGAAEGDACAGDLREVVARKVGRRQGDVVGASGEEHGLSAGSETWLLWRIAWLLGLELPPTG
jgi:hypothetical protein